MTLSTYHLFTGVWIFFSIIIFLTLLKITVPYGRHTRQGWGPMLSERFGWVFMEFPSVAVMPILFAMSPSKKNLVLVLFFLLWELHYINRTFIYPLRIRGNRKLMPLAVVFTAFFFTIINGYLNGIYLFYIADRYALSWFGDPRFIAGMIVFFTGFFINQVSDSILRNLRKKNGTTAFPKVFSLNGSPVPTTSVKWWSGWGGRYLPGQWLGLPSSSGPRRTSSPVPSPITAGTTWSSMNIQKSGMLSYPTCSRGMPPLPSIQPRDCRC